MDARPPRLLDTDSDTQENDDLSNSADTTRNEPTLSPNEDEPIIYASSSTSTCTSIT